LESNHKENVKRKADLTSLCKNSLEDQVATRFKGSLVIKHAKGIIAGKGKDSSDGCPMPRSHESTGSRMKLTISSTHASPSYHLITATWDGEKGTKFGPECTLPLPQHEALHWVYVEYCKHTQGSRGRNAFENHLSKIILFVDSVIQSYRT
jgi:hypothetical protein